MKRICCVVFLFVSVLIGGNGPEVLGYFPQEQTGSVGEQAAIDPERQARWWKGNLHTHSLWSDGNDFPEVISDWYRQRGYHFLAISDHNVLQEGQKWMAVGTVQQRSHGQGMERYLERFGKSWVETRGEPGTEKYQVRLKPLDEYRYLLERNDHFILIPAEEITDSAEGHPVHMNATNLDEVIKPLGGKTVREAMENNLRAVLEIEKAKGRQILPHLNHPNFKYGITFEDLAAVMSERFFEVYNGHPGVNHLGDANNPGVERMWDLANHLRVNKLGGTLLYGVGTDDSHEYFGKEGSRPGRGWVMVRSKFLTPEHLIRAMKAGDFYASSGATLKDVRWQADGGTLSVEIDAQEGVTYTTEYLVTDVDAKPEDIARLGLATQELSSSYSLKKGESIVRAVVTSSLAPADAVWSTQKQQAWTQPFRAVP
jgi:hypothetical protein